MEDNSPYQHALSEKPGRDLRDVNCVEIVTRMLIPALGVPSIIGYCILRSISVTRTLGPYTAIDMSDC